ncbi:MAG: phosphate ABC transporter substrate-binding protein [Leptolyngbyaceae cyanobacterium SL_5_9]|nr:phosphate ABC transporter substrate-binding protein [Leptolyngbyaceae cyanobacterium SL_5_9]NJO72851.1 phosphate ABC transporter substrate-binding protein [Leptolyngbyaceae cyanobacterium RM1_406_9]
MTRKNETKILLLALAITTALVVIGLSSLCNFGGSLAIFCPALDSVPLPAQTAPDQTPAEQTSFAQTSARSFAEVENVPNGLFSYGGSTVWAPIRKDVDSAIQTVFPQFQLRYKDPDGEAPSSPGGIAMLLRNEIDFAQSSRAVTMEELEEAERRGVSLKEVPVAIDGPAVIVNPSLNIPGLTVQQFEAIFAGEITNWQEVGGPNLAIQTYGKETRDSGEHFRLIGTTTEAVQAIANDPSGIFWSSASLVVSQCGVKPLPIGNTPDSLIAPYQGALVPASECPTKRNQVNTEVFRSGEYPLSRRLLVIFKQSGDRDQQAGEAYAKMLLTAQGQDLIAKAGFVSLQ